MPAVRQALIDACVAEGWGWNSGAEVLSKGTMFFRLQVVSGFLTLLGRTSETGGDAPSVVRIGNPPSAPITWPLTYHVFVFPSEVFLVINYSVEYHQFAAFGLSRVEGLPGTGIWVAASLEASGPSASSSGGFINIGPEQGSSSDGRCTPALFWATYTDSSRNRTYWVHSDLDGQGWWIRQSEYGFLVGIGALAPLMGLLPNSWNSETVLLPIRCYKLRPSSKVSLTVDVENARYIRIDNLEPGDVISLGDDRWKVFPWYRKSLAERDGGFSINHTGTFGWAIRYEGP